MALTPTQDFGVQPLLALSAVDHGVFGLVIAALSAVAAIFYTTAADRRAHLEADRGLGGWLAGPSLAVASLSAAGLALVPGSAYEIGWQWIVAPVAILLALIPVAWFAVPLFVNLNLATPYEYLERRFGGEVRSVASAAFVLWRLLWLVGLLVLPARLLAVAGVDLPQWLIVLGLGLAGVTLAWCGGLRGIAWFDLVAIGLVIVTAVIVLLAIVAQVDGGWRGLWRAADALGRNDMPGRSWNPGDAWSLWTALPSLTVSAIIFYVVDQVAAQRWLAAGGVGPARLGLAMQGLTTALLLVLLTSVGIGLAVFYNQRADAVRPIWVANVNPVDGRSQLDPATGTPLLDLRADRLDAETISDLVAAGRVIRPNTDGEILSSTEGLIDSDTGELQVERLLMRRPMREGRRSELILHIEARPELFPYFALRQLPWGLSGLAAATLAVGAISAFAAGLNGIATILLVDGFDRWEALRGWCAGLRGKSAGELDDGDQLLVARITVAALGGVAMFAALLFMGRDDAAAGLVELAGCVGGPLVGLFTLGILSRRATPTAAIIAFAVGVLLACWLWTGSLDPATSPLAVLWPFRHLAAGWALVVGALATHAAGYGLSFVLGTPKPEAELRGLVLGQGELGVLTQEPTAKIAIPNFPEPQPPAKESAKTAETPHEKSRWKGNA